MTRRIFALLIAAVLTVSLLASCKPDDIDTPDTTGPMDTSTNQDTENVIYDKTSELYIILADSVEADITNEFTYELNWLRDESVIYASADSEVHEHEIVFGNTDRDISKVALSRMDTIDVGSSTDEMRYLIYSDGASLAVVWDEDEENIACGAVMTYLLENCTNDSFSAKKGVVHKGSIDLLDYYYKIDKAYKDEQWAGVEEKLGTESTNALKEYYKLFDTDVVTWIANLYEPDICVCKGLYGKIECEKTKYCGTGGFYYSNSARDTVGYLPDIESTVHAMTLVEYLGMADQRGGSWTDVFTDEMKEQIGRFVYALEESNGYFYHPQWGRDLEDQQVAGRGRFLASATTILKTLGITPKYTTASGLAGEDAVSPVSLTTRLGRSAVNAVSKVVAASGSYASHLQSLDTFKAYLDTLKINEQSYHVGNLLEAQAPQIVTRDRQLGTSSNPTPLQDYLFRWLASKQNTANGTWDFRKEGDIGFNYYELTNGLMKISSTYKACKRPFPNADKAIQTSLNAIMHTEEDDFITSVYNPWTTIDALLNNIRSYEVNGYAVASEILANLRSQAVQAIKVTTNKISSYINDDGSASYYANNTSNSTLNNLPAAVPGSLEGDLNGANIALGSTLDSMCSALGVERPILCGEEQRYVFRRIVKELTQVIKDKEDDLYIPNPYDFEDDAVGKPSDIFEANITEGYGTANIIEDPTGAGKGNVVEFNHALGKTETLTLDCMNTSNLANTYVFEGDFYLKSQSNPISMQLFLGETPFATYLLQFKTSNGKLQIWESSSNDVNFSIDEYLGIEIDMNTWFRLKVEYYYAAGDNTRIKIYCDTDLSDGEDMKLYAVTDNYFDLQGSNGTASAKFNSSMILASAYTPLTAYMDNICCYKTQAKYAAVTDPDNQPYINVDAPDKESETFDFADGVIPDKFTVTADDGNAKVNSEGKLEITGYSSLTIPKSTLTKDSSCEYFSFKVNFKEGSVDEKLLQISAMDYSTLMFGFYAVVKEDADGKYVVLQQFAKDEGPIIEDIKIPFGTETELSFAYFADKSVVIIGVNGKFGAESAWFASKVEKLRMDSVNISTAMDKFSLTLDDFVVEKNTLKLDDVTVPEVDEKIYKFTVGKENLVLEGTGTTVSGGALNMNITDSGKHSVTVPINQRTNSVNTVIAELQLKYTDCAVGNTHTLNFTDEDGNVILSYMIRGDGSRFDLYEVKGDGTGNLLTTFNSSEFVKLKFEIDLNKEHIYIYQNGELVAESDVFCGDDFIDNDFYKFIIESGAQKSNSVIDNIRFESLYVIK